MDKLDVRLAFVGVEAGAVPLLQADDDFLRMAGQASESAWRSLHKVTQLTECHNGNRRLLPGEPAIDRR